MEIFGPIIYVVCSLLSKGISIPITPSTTPTPGNQAAHSIGQTDETEKHKPLSSFEEELKSQMFEKNGLPQFKPESIGKEMEPRKEEKEKLSHAFDNYIVDEIDVEQILKNALTTLQRHPEILKELIEDEERKLADELSPYTDADATNTIDQRSGSKFNQVPKQIQTKSGQNRVPYEEFKDSPVDVSHPETLVQYAVPGNLKPHADIKDRMQAVPFDFSMLPLEGGIEDPLFLDTSEQSLEARKMMHDTGTQGTENKNELFNDNEDKTSKKNDKSTDKETQDFIKDLDNGLASLTQEEKDQLFSLFPPKFESGPRLLPNDLKNQGSDEFESVPRLLPKDLKNQGSAEKVVEYPKSQNRQTQTVAEEVKMVVPNEKGEGGNTVSEQYMLPDDKFVLSLPEAEFLEKLRLMEQEAENNLKLQDLEFPSVMFNKVGQDDNKVQLTEKVLADGGNIPPEVNGVNAQHVIKRSDEDDLHALAGMKA